MRADSPFLLALACVPFACQKPDPPVLMPGGDLAPARGPTVAKLIPSPAPAPAVPPRRFLAAAELTPDEAPIVARLTAFLKSKDVARRSVLAAEIERFPGYRPERVSDWLHLTGVHPTPPASELGAVTRHEVEIDKVMTDAEDIRPLAVRLPRAYVPSRPWPLVLCWHPTGAVGEMMVRAAQTLLGDRADDFILAGPDGYRPLNIDSRRCVSTEPLRIVDYLRHEFHIDSDRIYAIGWSQGGYAVWSFATFFGDQLAAAIPVSATYDAAPEVPGLWESLLPNVRPVPVLASWGTNDPVPALDFTLSKPQGAIGQLNERLLKLTPELKLDISHWWIENGGHGFDVSPEEALKFLSRRRRLATTVQHRFRFLHQGSAGWLQALSWAGPQWGEAERRFPAQPGEPERDALARGIQERLALLEGEATRNAFAIRTVHVGQLALWLHDGMVDWGKPVRVAISGRAVLEGPVRRDLLLCLGEARKSGDFDRLRWACLRFDEQGALHK